MSHITPVFLLGFFLGCAHTDHRAVNELCWLLTHCERLLPVLRVCPYMESTWNTGHGFHCDLDTYQLHEVQDISINGPWSLHWFVKRHPEGQNNFPSSLNVYRYFRIIVADTSQYSKGLSVSTANQLSNQKCIGARNIFPLLSVSHDSLTPLVLSFMKVQVYSHPH